VDRGVLARFGGRGTKRRGWSGDRVQPYMHLGGGGQRRGLAPLKISQKD
jgi:hypothetical protein